MRGASLHSSDSVRDGYCRINSQYHVYVILHTVYGMQLISTHLAFVPDVGV